MDEPTTIGARLRALRRWRGLTLRELAGLSGISASLLSMVENGERMFDPRSHISAVAAALRVSETDLINGPHLGTDPEQSAPHGVVPTLREALTGNTFDDPNAEWARPLPELRALLFGPLAQLRDHADYRRRGELVAPVIDELHFHVATGDEADQKLALRLLVEACNAAGMTLKHLGYTDLSYVATTRAVEAARILDDPVMGGQAAYLRALTMPKSASWQRPHQIAAAAAEPARGLLANPVGRQTYGMLHLAAGLAAAAMRNPDLANDHLAEATNIAARLGENPDAWMAFGPTNVGIWTVAIAIEHGDYGQAVELSARVDPRRLGNRERRAWLHADTGRALAHLKGREREAVTRLREAEQTAPQRIRNSALARETVQYLRGRNLPTTTARELRGMAARMGVPH